MRTPLVRTGGILVQDTSGHAAPQRGAAVAGPSGKEPAKEEAVFGALGYDKIGNRCVSFWLPAQKKSHVGSRYNSSTVRGPPDGPRCAPCCARRRSQGPNGRCCAGLCAGQPGDPAGFLAGRFSPVLPVKSQP